MLQLMRQLHQRKLGRSLLWMRIVWSRMQRRPRALKRIRSKWDDFQYSTTRSFQKHIAWSASLKHDKRKHRRTRHSVRTPYLTAREGT